MRWFVILALLLQATFNFLAPCRAEEPLVRHVLLIGIDGLSATAITPEAAPVMSRLVAEGASTMHARAVMPTSSAPNWASMLMGAGPEQHGVINNGYDRKKAVIQPTVMGDEGLFPTIFSVVRKASPDAPIGVVYQWNDIPTLIEQSACSIVEKGDDALDATRRTEMILKQAPALAFVHFDFVDGAGHSHGWDSAAYVDAVKLADRCVGQLLDSLDRLKLRSETLVIVTSDHGGIGKGHGGNTMQELEIPWIASGPHVRKGQEIQIPVNQYDTAATIAWALGAMRPDCWIAQPVKDAFSLPQQAE